MSVPQSELLSLIAAAKSLGVRGLAEDGVLAREEEAREAREVKDAREAREAREARDARDAREEPKGVKREGEREVARELPALIKKPKISTGSRLVNSRPRVSLLNPSLFDDKPVST